MPPILKQWTKYCDSLGSRVRVSQGASIVEGIAQGLGADGSLLIRQASGKIHQHIAGDVQVLS
jgi:biotin-(acetyl-CoA carboxylase) ligase